MPIIMNIFHMQIQQCTHEFNARPCMDLSKGLLYLDVFILLTSIKVQTGGGANDKRASMQSLLCLTQEAFCH